VPFRSIGVTGAFTECDSISTHGGNGTVEPVSFAFQFRDDRLCVQGHLDEIQMSAKVVIIPTESDSVADGCKTEQV